MSGVSKDEVRSIVREELEPLRIDIDGRFSVHDTDIKELKSDVKELKSDVRDLKTDFTSLSVQFEDMNGKLDAVIEYITDPVKQEREAVLNSRVDRLETDMAIVKLALRS